MQNRPRAIIGTQPNEGETVVLAVVEHVAVSQISPYFNVNFLLSQNVLLCRISSLPFSLQNFGVSSRFPLFFSISFYLYCVKFCRLYSQFWYSRHANFSIYSVPPLVYCNLFTLFLHMSSACVWFNELLANSFSITFSSFPLFLSLNSCLLSNA
jgi:hypothetical protein